jgi:hypothetical protein
VAGLIRETWAAVRATCDALGLELPVALLSLIAAFLAGFVWAALVDPAGRAAMRF